MVDCRNRITSFYKTGCTSSEMSVGVEEPAGKPDFVIEKCFDSVKVTMWFIVCGLSGLLLTVSADVKMFPVYSSVTGLPTKLNNTVDIIVENLYKVRSGQQQLSVDDDAESRSSKSSQEDLYLASLKEDCNSRSITSCWTYNALLFVQNMLQPIPQRTKTGRSIPTTGPHLVALPLNGNGSAYSILGRSSYWGLGDVYQFLEKQVSRFIQGHGVVFPITTWEEAVRSDFQEPVLLDDESRSVQDAGGNERKIKHKKSILFPLLVLFKFFKIKMILVPILLSVLLVKKLLIITLALAPNLIGFFRPCRPGFTPPFGIASAGLLQDVTDSRGEFSTLYNSYASPYRDYHNYRTRNRDIGRYDTEPASHSTTDGQDY